MNNLNIEYQNISKLTPYARNSRTHSDEQVSQIAASIKEFGWTNPILIDEQDGIIAGHGRLMAAQRLNESDVPTIRLVGLTEAQKKAYVIADNKLALNAGWDEEMLAIELEDLIGENYNTDLLGFSDKEINNILSTSGTDYEGLTDEDEVPDVDKTDIKEGDMFALGQHRIICGDSTNKDVLNKLLGKETIDLLLTDPPYGVNYSQKNEFLNKWDEGKRLQRDIVNDEIEDLESFCTSFLNIIPFSQYNICYVFMGGQKLHHLRNAFDLSKLKFSQYLIWNKNNHVLGRNDYFPKHEFICYGWKNKHKFYGTSSTTVLDFDKPLKSDLHPTMKPVALLEKLINDGSLPNQNVYEPFLGSGSTLIAAEKTNRKCLGIELEPHYMQVIIDRWQDYTGEKAEKINGETLQD
tara:strand:- start:458 stop:1681 length:1224 start_codon:yes stop_codon:yes gene_type:complete